MTHICVGFIATRKQLR